MEELAKQKAAVLQWNADHADELKAAKQAERAAQRSAAAEAAKGRISSWKRPGEDWGNSGTPLSLDLWTRVLEHLCNDIEPEGVRSASVIARDLCNAGMACKELYVSANQAFHCLAALCPPIELEAEWAACLPGPMALKLPQLKALAPHAGVQKSLPKPTLALGLLEAWNLQCPTQVPPRVIMEVAKERKSSLSELSSAELTRAYRYIPGLLGSGLCFVFDVRQALVKLGLTSLPLLTPAVQQAQRREQQEARERQLKQAAAAIARRQAAQAARQAAQQGAPQQAAATGSNCVVCGKNKAAANCPFVCCGACCNHPDCARHRK